MVANRLTFGLVHQPVAVLSPYFQFSKNSVYLYAMGGIKKEEKEIVGSRATMTKKSSVTTKNSSAATKKLRATTKTEKSVTSAANAKKAPAAKSAPAKAATATNSSSAKAKKPVAGIDENGTFRAWDNAKTVAKSKKADSPKSSVEERAADKKATAEAEKKLAAAKKADPNAGMAKKEVNAADYSDDKIRHLDALEHIRLRSGMYIGRLGDGSNQNDGIYILLK